MNKVAVILDKEWLELRQQRALLAGVILPPLLLALLPIGIAFGVARVPAGYSSTNSLPPGALNLPAFAGFNESELGQAILGQQFATLLLLLPVLIPSVIASYSIVGEKTNRTLEPVLATPVRTWELLLAKSLASLVPAVAITWLCATIFALGMHAVALSPRVASAIISPGWLLVLLLCVPLLALIAVAAMVAVSSRVNDPRTAQQLSGIAVVPIMLIFFGQLAGILVLRPSLILAAAVVLGLIAALAIWGAARLFQREVILTRWK